MKMKGTTQKVFILVVGVIVFVLIAGCQESATTRLSSSKTGGPADAKKSRLVAAENIELKKELEKRGREIKKQEELLAKCREEKNLQQEKANENIELKKELEQRSREIKRQEGLLAKCQKERNLRQGKTGEIVEGETDELSEFIMEQLSKLQEENENLKSQIENLKAELVKHQQGDKPKE
jgi:hypothetical protein